MSLVLPFERRRAVLTPTRRRQVALRTAYGLLGVALAVYIVSILLRHSGSYSSWLDGALVDGIEVGGGLLAVLGALVRSRGRVAGLAVAAALLSWSIGDIVVTIQSLGGATPPTPSLADVFYLGFYPLVYVGVLLTLSKELKGLTGPIWLDGLVAGLGAATVCAAFAFHRILVLTGTSAWATVTDLAYPVGDLLLLGLVAGGLTVLGSDRKRPWILLAAGCALNVVGDTAHLFERSLAGLGVGSLLDAVAWPASILVISSAVWSRSAAPDPFAPRRPAALLLPQLAGASALAILFLGTLQSLNRVALVLATATLFVAGIRLAMSMRSLRNLSQERHRQAITDDLTGLANRRHLFGVLDGFFAQYNDVSPERQLAFLFVDLDAFKEINDSFGHPSGDELLRQLGPRFAASLRSCDLLVRLGGDEFAVVLVDGDAEFAIEVAQRLSASLDEPFTLGDLDVSVGASIGIAVAPEHGRTSADLVWSADVAMYRAKGARSSFAVFEEDIDHESRLRSAGELRAALEKGHLLLHYQPQLDLRTGEVTGVEALVRWAHPRLGLLTPGQFLPVAEEAGLMRMVTGFVLEEAFSQCAAWRAAGRHLVISVNISPTNLLDAGFTDLVRHLLKRYGLPADVLVVEVTETCIISEFERSRLVIEELRDLGLVVSIDDFGAGFTSLAYLGSLAVGELKLDRMFVAGLTGPEKARDAELVRATIDLAHTMGLRVVVEGIEDQGTLDLVTDFGCDLVQGYFVKAPAPADELLSWLGSRGPKPVAEQRA